MSPSSSEPSSSLQQGIGSQLQVLNLGYIGEASSPFELTHTYLQNSLAPLFTSYEADKYPHEEEGKRSAMGLAKLHKQMAELMVSLIQCQQNLEIPEIQLVNDPEIKAKNKKAVKENRVLTVEDFMDKISDQDFLNSLQYRVNKWIQEIRKITKLERDPTGGTALQEINFWLGLEKVLNHSKQNKSIRNDFV
jgi:dynein heavy chain 1, cytosolic